MSKGKPIPVRLGTAEDAALGALMEKTALNKSELIRRAVRLLARESARRGDARWILDLTSTQQAPDVSYSPRLNEDPETPKP